jgi:hypothetical protein
MRWSSPAYPPSAPGPRGPRRTRRARTPRLEGDGIRARLCCRCRQYLPSKSYGHQGQVPAGRPTSAVANNRQIDVEHSDESPRKAPHVATQPCEVNDPSLTVTQVAMRLSSRGICPRYLLQEFPSSFCMPKVYRTSRSGQEHFRAGAGSPGQEPDRLDGGCDVAARTTANQERMEKGSLVLWERSIITFLTRVYSCKACHPLSRPYPLCLTPPKGAWAAALR